MIQKLGDATTAQRGFAATNGLAGRPDQAGTVDPSSATDPSTLAGTSAAKPDPNTPILLNPKLVYDSDTQRVLIQFRDQSGKIERQYPSERELAAYRQAANSKVEKTSAEAFGRSDDQPATAPTPANPRPSAAPVPVTDTTAPSPAPTRERPASAPQARTAREPGPSAAPFGSFAFAV